MSKNMNKKSQITSIKNEEFDALLEARYGLKKEDLERISKSNKEQKCWSKPTSVIEKTEKVVEQHPSKKDKGFLAALALIAGSWLLGKAEQSKPQQPQPLTAEEEFQITERRLMRDNYLRYLNRE